MYPIEFNKDRANELIASITAGTDVPAPAGGWTPGTMLQVAGAMLFAAMSHGRPETEPAQSSAGTNGEGTLGTLADDLHMAIDFYSDLTMMVCGGSYDERFEPELHAVVLRDGDQRAFKLLDGGKQG